MKRSLLSLAVAVSICAPVKAGAQEWEQAKGWIELGAKKVDIALAQPSTDDYLLEMARKSDVNLLAEATYSATDAPLEGEWKTDWSAASNGRWSGPVLSLFLELAAERNLSWKQQQPGTYLFWAEPDLAALAREIIASRPESERDLATMTKAALAEQSNSDWMFGQGGVNVVLHEYYKRVHGWDGTSPDLPPDVKLADLPADVRDAVKRDAIKKMQPPQVHQASQLLFLSDEFWKTAVVRTDKGPDNGQVRPRLTISGSSDGISALLVLQYLDEPQARQSMSTHVRPQPGALAKVLVRRNAQIAPTKAEATTDAKPGDAKSGDATNADAALSADATLAVKVSLEAKREALADVLASLQKKSGVALSVAPDAALAGTRLTLRVRDLPLAACMNSLSGLLGVSWQKDGAAYTMKPAVSGLDAKLLRLGDPSWFLYWRLVPSTAPANLKMKERTDWKQLLDFADANALALHRRTEKTEETTQSPGGGSSTTINSRVVETGGIAVADLPPEWQQKLRFFVQTQAANEVLRDLQARSKQAVVSDDCVIHLEVPKDGFSRVISAQGTVDLPMPPQASLRTPQGEVITTLQFTAFSTDQNTHEIIPWEVRDPSQVAPPPMPPQPMP